MLSFLKAKPIEVDYQVAKIYRSSNEFVSAVPSAVREFVISTMALHTNDGCVACLNPHEKAMEEVNLERPHSCALLISVRGVEVYAVVIFTHGQTNHHDLAKKIAGLIGASSCVFDDVRIRYFV